jgi:hypothetical protein
MTHQNDQAAAREPQRTTQAARGGLADQAAAHVAEHAPMAELADQAAVAPGELARRELARRPVIVGRTTLHRSAWFVR